MRVRLRPLLSGAVSLAGTAQVSAPVPARLALPLVPSGHNGQVNVQDRTVFSSDRRGEEEG
jgi:hypothetical protein